LASIALNTGNTHSETLLPSVEALLRMCDLTADDVDIFACSSGPGSFTGVRIGASTVKGMAFGKNKPCIGVSTLEALAYNLRGFDGILSPVMNARRSQVYNALFRVRDGRLERLCPDRAIALDELARELEAYAGETVYLSGDGYDMTRAALADLNIPETPEELIYQSGYSVAMCALDAYEKGDRTTDEQLVPTYLRLPQAERERLEKQGQKLQ
jgi:tRNA threonylcarbamoyladenosine biosynthesis protein TsaB